MKENKGINHIDNLGRQVFTYSENKLLDQITLEIMSAWKKDLLIMKKYHQQIVNSSEEVMRTSNSIVSHFPEIENFLSQPGFKSLYEQFTERNEQIGDNLNDITKNIYEIKNRIDKIETNINKKESVTENKEFIKKTKILSQFFRRFSEFLDRKGF